MKTSANKTSTKTFFGCPGLHDFLAYHPRMRILYLALLILIFNTPVAFGAGCTDATNQTSCNALAGCEFINNTCTPCQNGYYKGQNSDLCDECPNGYDYTQITNGVGATKMGQCYKFCTRTEQDGTIKTPASPNEYYPNECAYTISCVTSDDLCNSYALAPIDNECYPVWTEGTNCDQGNKSTGIEIYHATDGITINYCTNKTQCDPGYHFEENNNYYCSRAKLGQCVSDKKPCANIDKLKNTCGGTISGEASWDTDKNRYDLSACACTIISEANHGTLQTTCFHGKTINEWTDCTKEMIYCKAGYWASPDKKDDCSEVGNGYYSVADDTDRQKCPAGSTTSMTTAASINNCHMTAGKTKICDTENNCITLPGNDSKFFYNGKTQ